MNQLYESVEVHQPILSLSLHVGCGGGEPVLALDKAALPFVILIVYIFFVFYVGCRLRLLHSKLALSLDFFFLLYK